MPRTTRPQKNDDDGKEDEATSNQKQVAQNPFGAAFGSPSNDAKDEVTEKSVGESGDKFDPFFNSTANPSTPQKPSTATDPFGAFANTTVAKEQPDASPFAKDPFGAFVDKTK